MKIHLLFFFICLSFNSSAQIPSTQKANLFLGSSIAIDFAIGGFGNILTGIDNNFFGSSFWKGDTPFEILIQIESFTTICKLSINNSQ